MITSSAALIVLKNFLPPPLSRFPLYCAGEETAKQAARMGFKDITVASTVEELMPKLPERALIYYRGKHIAHPITHSQLTEQIVYTANYTDISDAFLAQPFKGITLCSKRGAKRVAALVLEKQAAESKSYAVLFKRGYCQNLRLAWPQGRVKIDYTIMSLKNQPLPRF